VLTGDNDLVQEIQVKQSDASARWVWGAFKMTGAHLASLHELWNERQCSDQYIGTLVNDYISKGGTARGVKRGEIYLDVGTLHGYREAVRVLSSDQIAA
jgi:glucose-1-phosphate thymidylyltransferase